MSLKEKNAEGYYQNKLRREQFGTAPEKLQLTKPLVSHGFDQQEQSRSTVNKHAISSCCGDIVSINIMSMLCANAKM
jgi:hypothetical protein